MTRGVRVEVSRRSLSLVATVLIGVCLSVTLIQSAEAQTIIDVATGSDLVNALTTVDNNPGTSYRINFNQSITLDNATTLPAINTTSPLTISGGNNTLNGGGVQRGFLVYAGTVAISDLTIANTKAVGGDGGGGQSGGGGLGAGGALFVASAGSLTISNVRLTNNNATGGDRGGDGSDSGGGGGLGGSGGNGGGGGGLGLGAKGGDLGGANGSPGIVLGAPGGGSGSSGGAGGSSGGGGGRCRRQRS